MNIKTANRLLDLRKNNNLSQEQLAEKIGVSRQAVSKWERAEASPDIDNFILLSKLYNMSLDELIDNEVLPKKEEPLSSTEIINTKTSKNHQLTDKTLEDYDLKSALDQVAQSIDDVNSIENEIHKVTKKAKKKKMVFRITNIPYSLIITIIYLILGFNFNWWHPAWILFLTIPLYYCCFVEVDEDE